jgi:hypothetical protein
MLLGRNPVLFDTSGSKELDPGLKLAGATWEGLLKAPEEYHTIARVII